VFLGTCEIKKREEEIMKIALLTLMASALLMAHDGQDKNAPAKKTKSTQAASSTSIPAGATQIEPGLYRYTDSKGKIWLYRNTPFGISKWEEDYARRSAVKDTTTPTTVTDLGDSVKFERKMPFGTNTWVKKKTDLTDEEKGILAASKNAEPAGDSQAKPQTGKATEKQ
jgi:hypothetical protein